jgi:hypothetical protein
MERQGIRTEVIDRNNYGGRERDVPDTILQREMLVDAPATVILLTGDGAGWNVRKGFMNTLQCMKKRGWEVELLSWHQSCNARLRQWVETNGHFTCLDHFYKSITFVEPSDRDKGRKLDAVELWKKRAGLFAPPPPPPGQRWDDYPSSYPQELYSLGHQQRSTLVDQLALYIHALVLT